MDTADQNPSPIPAAIQPANEATVPDNAPGNGSPSPASGNEDYHKKLSEQLTKLDQIYDGEFTGKITAKGTEAHFLKEPPISTPEFLKESSDGQKNAIEKAGLVGFVPGYGLVLIEGTAASKLYQYMHADDKKRYGETLETSVGNVSYAYEKPEIKSLEDLIGGADPKILTDVNLWNQATKTTAEIAEMKRFVQREAKVEEAIREAYETTSKLAEKAG